MRRAVRSAKLFVSKILLYFVETENKLEFSKEGNYEWKNI
jgi:hypothetical protein